MSNSNTTEAQRKTSPTLIQAQSDRPVAASETTTQHAREPEEKRLDIEERWQEIAVAAYYLAERRGFEAGRELDDWLEAEAQIAQQARVQGG